MDQREWNLSCHVVDPSEIQCGFSRRQSMQAAFEIIANFDGWEFLGSVLESDCKMLI